ncbi:hypothetical protein I2486_04300 [Cellulophaga sp. E16_2]|uniref:Uncharacterized protein n=1 Tax=Cellulophaga algicola (strain DSM 14237 / IC166 / ACAM 630) TaxID=688270 RepID=E6X3P2_CELAD|nr:MULTISPECIES: hypothetical protein [Cellulophaga]ADV48195.1 hypothetical protein Celal_0868 [Cellulophaga algicola DSM 14237]MBO0590620.1 hypothetical protein [Cellulophaga sp. E16_2]
MKNLFNLCLEVIDGNPIVFIVLSAIVASGLLYIEIKNNYRRRAINKQ